MLIPKKKELYTQKQGFYDELFLIPHYWVVTKKYGIIDPIIAQFKSFITKEITDNNYRIG